MTVPHANSAPAAIAKTSTWPEILKLALAIYVPAALLLAAVLYIFLRMDVDTRLQKVQAQEAAEVNISKQLLAHDFDYATSDLLFLAHAPSVSRYINDGSPTEKQRVTENFRNMALSKGRYDQIRYIDSGGKEKIRVNLVDNKAVLVPENELQDKSDRYFFRDTLRLNAGEIYISPLDLNVENGKIEQPYKPTLRFGTPLFNRAGKKMGILLINYHGQELLNDFTHSMNEKYHAMLLNSDGYWLSSPDPTQEWGFMFGLDNTFGKHHPEAWAKISTMQQDNMLASEGLYTFTTFHLRPDALHNPASSMAAGNTSTQEDYFWKIVSLVPASELPAISIYQYPRSFTLFILSLLLLALLAIYFANTRLNRKYLRAAIFEREAQLREITSTLGEGIFVVDNHESITFINPEASRLLGWSSAEMMGKNAHKLFHYCKLDGSPITAGECDIYRVMQSGNPYRSDSQVFWRKDGSSLHVDVNATPILRNGKNVGAVVAFSDISKQKQAEIILLNNEAQLRQAQRLAHLGSWELDLTSQKLTWSDEIFRIFEMDPSVFDASYEAFLNAIHPEDREHVNRAYTESVQNHTPYNIEHRLLFADGYIKHVLERGETFYDADDKALRSIGTVQDITDQKLAEKERLRAEALFHMVFNNVADGIVIHDLNGKFIEVNQIICDRLDYNREELLQVSPADINDPEGAAKFSERGQQLREKGHITFETAHIRKDGLKIPVEVNSSLIEYQGKPATLSVVRDISERKAIQEALRSSEATARALLNATTESAILIDVSGNVLAINEVGAKRLSKLQKEIIGKNIYDLLPADVSARRKKIIDEVVRSGQAIQTRDERSGIHFDMNMYPIVDAQGRVINIAIYATDVTERMKLQAEETLLHHIDQQVMRNDSLPVLLQFICNEIVQLFGYQFVWLGKKEAGGEFSIPAQSGNASAYLKDMLRVGVRWDDSLQGKGPAGTCVRSGHTQVFNISDSSFQPWRDAATHFGFKSIAGIPLIVRGEVYGALMLYSKLEHDFDDVSTLQRLSGIASRICVALEMALDQQQLRLLSTALASAGNGVFITDALGKIQWVNNAFTRLTGFSSAESIGRYPSLLKSGKQDNAFYQKQWKTIQQGKIWSRETIERHKSGKLFTVQQTITPIKNDIGEISHYISILDDITVQKEAAARIQYMAHFDALTALPNRTLFHDRLRQTLAQAKRDDQSCALMFLDLDKFKAVNDTLGHHIGDLLLQAVANRIKASVREVDTVSRLAGDEFTVLLPHVSGREDATLIAEKITAALAEPFMLDGKEVNIGSSTGIAFYPADADNDEALLKCADNAMYIAKEQGRGTFRFYQAPAQS